MTEFKAEARFEDVKAVRRSTTAAASGSARPNCSEIRVYRHQWAQPGVSGLSTRATERPVMSTVAVEPKLEDGTIGR